MSRVNYNCKVYKIQCYCGCDKLYIGSTSNILSKRFSDHKGACKKHPNIKLYSHMREVGYKNMKIIEIEEFIARDKTHQNMVEDTYIRSYNTINNGLNGIRAYITVDEKKQREKQYYEQNKQHKKQYHKQYHIENKEQIKQHKKQYYEQNKEQINQRDKIYYEQNKEHLNQKKKQYYEQNKEHIKQLVVCDCGSCIRKYSVSKHKRTKKHLHWEQIYNFIYE